MSIKTSLTKKIISDFNNFLGKQMKFLNLTWWPMGSKWPSFKYKQKEKVKIDWKNYLWSKLLQTCQYHIHVTWKINTSFNPLYLGADIRTQSTCSTFQSINLTYHERTTFIGRKTYQCTNLAMHVLRVLMSTPLYFAFLNYYRSFLQELFLIQELRSLPNIIQ